MPRTSCLKGKHGKWRRRLSGLLAAATLIASGVQASEKVDLDKLWLPSSYLRHLTRLYDAARVVKAWPGCHEFLEGTSHLGRTRLEHPVFTLTCRNAAGETFSVVVDGPTLQKVDEARPGGLVSFAQLTQEREAAQARERERQARLKEQGVLQNWVWATGEERREWQRWWQAESVRRNQLWEQCVLALRERVGNMQALEWRDVEQPEPTMMGTPALDYHPPLSYRVDFDAENYDGEPLFYRALCTESDDGVALDIGARERE